MNLVIDIGNSRIKLSVFNRGDVLFTIPLDEISPENIQMLKNEHPSLDQAILSTVKDISPELKNYLASNFSTFIELDAETPLPIENHYQTKKTLGKDRIAAVVGAFDLYPNTNILVIDAGTAITFDILNDKGQYLGGNISPGLEMRFKALNKFTGRLPLVKKNDFNNLYGRSTEEAIRAGVQHGIVFETDKAIDTFKEFYNNLKVIITGGDANFFDKKLKNSFFVHFNLTALGLNRILEHNGEN
ncbi:MAG: type III pantothenate kinase [Tangfeifania sp.]